jgi:hypothetical protein
MLRLARRATASSPKESAELLATEWSALEKNTLRGFLLRGKPWTRPDGTTSYVPLLNFTSDDARFRFQRLALAAIDNLRGGAR